MPGNGRIGDERQAKLLQADPGGPLGIFASRHACEETVERDRLDLRPRQLRLDAAADQLRTAPGDRDRPAVDRRLLLAQQLFLGRPARESKCAPLLGVEPRALELFLHMMGQREVDIVTAQHQVIAHRDAAKSWTGRRLDDRDQAEVGRAAADVADQDQLACAHLALPSVLVRHDPTINAACGLLEQRDRGQSLARLAASIVSWRAASSNEAGTVSTTSWFSRRLTDRPGQRRRSRRPGYAACKTLTPRPARLS